MSCFGFLPLKDVPFFQVGCKEARTFLTFDPAACGVLVMRRNSSVPLKTKGPTCLVPFLGSVGFGSGFKVDGCTCACGRGG